MILKPKRRRHFRFRDGRNQAELVTAEPKRTYIGTVTVAPDETFAIALPADLDSADPAAIRTAIEAAEREKAEETSRLRRTFGLDVDKEGPSDK